MIANRFANLATIEEEEAVNDVSSPSFSLSRIVDDNTSFVSNFSSSSSQAKISDFFHSLDSYVAMTLVDVNTDIANNSDSYNMV